MVFGIGGGASRSRGNSRQQVWDQQAAFLTNLWPVVQGLFQEQNQNIFSVAQQTADEVGGYISGAGNILGDLASGADPGGAYMRSRLSDGNPYLQGSIDAYGQDIARNLAENILPELRSGGVAAGAPGGSRAYLAQGMAAQEATREFARGSNQMRLADLAQTDALAGRMGMQQMMASQAMAGLAEPAYNLGMSPYNAAWMPAMNYASILGSPVVLGRSDSESDSFDFGF